MNFNTIIEELEEIREDVNLSPHSNKRVALNYLRDLRDSMPDISNKEFNERVIDVMRFKRAEYKGVNDKKMFAPSRMFNIRKWNIHYKQMVENKTVTIDGDKHLLGVLKSYMSQEQIDTLFPCNNGTIGNTKLKFSINIYINNTFTPFGRKKKESTKESLEILQLGYNDTKLKKSSSKLKEVITHLGLKRKRPFRNPATHMKMLRALMLTFDSNCDPIDEIKKVIDYKCDEWLGTEYEKYLRPSTIFKPSNFWNYVDESGFVESTKFKLNAGEWT